MKKIGFLLVVIAALALFSSAQVMDDFFKQRIVNISEQDFWNSISPVKGLEKAVAAGKAGKRDLAYRLLGQYHARTLAVEAEAWLEAAVSVEGPEPVYLDRRTQAALFTVEFALADLPDALRASFWPLTGSETPVVTAEALREALLENSTLTWRVALDPRTGQLLLQTVDVQLSAELGADAIAEGFRSLSVEATQSQTVVFSEINQPLGEIELPG